MAKHPSPLEQAKTRERSSLASDWHRCERFWILNKQCPFQTAQIEEDDEDEPEERQRRQIPLALPGRHRKTKDAIGEVPADAQTFDIRDFVKMPGPPPPIPFPATEPKPGTEMPKPETIPEPIAAIQTLPDGMPAIDPTTIPNVNPAQIGSLIQWLNTNFITGLANKPSFSPSPLTSPSPRNLPTRALQLDDFLLRESVVRAGSAEQTFANQFASSMKPVSTIEREVNQSSSARRESEGEGRTGITRRQIVGAGAAIAAGMAGAAAVHESGRRGGGGGMHRPSRFPRDLRTAQ